MTVTRRIALEQLGWSTAGGDWTEIAAGLSIPVTGSSTPVGLVFSVQTMGASDVGIPFETQSDRALDPPILGDAGAITFTIDGSFGGVSTLYLRSQTTLFSDSNPPLLTVGTNTLLATATLGIFPAETTVTLTSAALTTIRALQTSRASWNGRIAMILILDSGAATSLANSGASQMYFTSGWEERFFQGMRGGPYGGKARFVRDSRYGMGTLSTDLVQDQYNPALWVRPWDVDPDDPEQTYRPKPGEGTTDDELGNL